MCHIWEQHLNQHPEENHLPLLIPMVLYTGLKPYVYSMDIANLFGKDKSLGKSLLLGPYRRIDIQKIPDEEIHNHPWCGFYELVTKHILLRDTLSLLKEVDKHFLEKNLSYAKHADEYIKAMLIYILDQGDIKDVNHFCELIQGQVSGPAEDKIMTFTEQLRQQGRQEGAEQRSKEIARTMLKEGADKQFIAKVTKLPLEVISTLK